MMVRIINRYCQVNWINKYLAIAFDQQTMIQNIVILLIANTFLPLLPIPPELFLPLPMLQPMLSQPTVYQHLNLTRLHTKQQFKKAFRDALKTLHPDRGGNQQTFTRVKNLKQIMEKSFRYYDTLNITDTDLALGQKIHEVVLSKETTYYVQMAIFYFIALLYGITFTIDDDLRPSRKYIIMATLIFAAYQFFIHNYSQITTVFDLLYPRQPIFVQKNILKNILSLVIAVIRTKFIRRKTEEKMALQELMKQDQSQMKYKQALIKLNKIYQTKIEKKAAEKKSLFTKIRSWISTILSIGILFLVIKGLFVSDQNNHQM